MTELPVLQGERVTLRPLIDADLDALTVIVASAAVRDWWPSAGDDARVRQELQGEGNYVTFAIEVDGALAGWLGVEDEQDPDYRHAGLDIVLAEEHQNRGLGPDALRTAVRWLIRGRGHHRFTIDPAVDNQRAIHAYQGVGFRPVGILRRAERGPDGTWRDALLMELLAEELRERHVDGEYGSRTGLGST